MKMTKDTSRIKAVLVEKKQAEKWPAELISGR